MISGRFSYGFFDVAMLTGEKVELQIRSDISESGWETLDSQDTDSNGRVSFTLPPGNRIRIAQIDDVLGRFKSLALYNFRLNVTGDNSSCFCSLAIVPRQSKCVVFSIDSSFAGSGGLKTHSSILLRSFSSIDSGNRSESATSFGGCSAFLERQRLFNPVYFLPSRHDEK